MQRVTYSLTVLPCNDMQYKIMKERLIDLTGVEVLNNTVVSHDRPFASIEYRWPNTRAVIQNNIVSHHICARDNARAKLKLNISSANRHFFHNYGKGDLHLSPNRKGAIDKGTPASRGKVIVDGDIEIERTKI
jgi:hypothetical protein